MYKLSFGLTVSTIGVVLSLFSCTVKESKEVVAFYNLENLFDTIDSPDVWDEEFTPGGKKHWTSERYNKKLKNMASVIAGIGATETVDAPAIVGLCEMENRTVLEDLVTTDMLKIYNYQIVHQDSPDKRGIDVALIYRPGIFKLQSYRAVPLYIYGENGDRIYTRDQLLVSGELDGEKLHFIVNHWPSRYGGKGRSIPLREEAGRLSRSIIDSVRKEEPDAHIILMGDLNDDPTDESVKQYLKAGLAPQPIGGDSLINVTAPLFLEGRGTLCYHNFWNLFDQIIVTPNLIYEGTKSYHISKTEIYDKQYLRQQEGKYKDYPFRTYVGNWYQGGSSDHFPSYVVLKK
jgi:hypothetical protein